MRNRNASEYRSGVSLHSHTCHSRESLRFLDALAKRSSILRFLLQRGRMQFKHRYGDELDFGNGWWTPPLDAHQALAIECRQLEDLDLRPIVSLSDHDTAMACLSLRAAGWSSEAVPISLEWSLPYSGAELHLGIHNIPSEIAVELTRILNEYTRRPWPSGLPAILEHVASCQAALIVLNHPLWDETGVGHDVHMEAVRKVLSTCGTFIHALEWNGLRSRRENLRVVGLAEAWSKPIVSGGDRHTLEANACINLTNARGFSEFADEVRQGYSTVMIMPVYHEPLTLRITRMVVDVLSETAGHPNGWSRWSDRVFYVRRGQGPQSLTTLLRQGTTGTLRLFDHATNYLPMLPLSAVGRLTTTDRDPVFL